MLLGWIACAARPPLPPAEGAHACGELGEAPPWLSLDLEIGGGEAPPTGAGADALRVATYNIHSGLGGDSWPIGRARATIESNLRAIAEHLAAESRAGRPLDVVGLNEVDLGARRSAWIDEAEFLAAELGRLTGDRYTAVTAETWRRTTLGREVRFGNTVLTRHPILESSSCLLDGTSACAFAAPGADTLPALAGASWLDHALGETRGVVRVRIDHRGRPVDVLVTHLDALAQSQREAQAAHLVSRFVEAGHATVLLGDLNAVPTYLTRGRRFFAEDRTHDIVTSGSLVDARVLLASLGGARDLDAWATSPSSAPTWPLDAVLATPDLAPRELRRIGAGESDHLGLAAAYVWAEADERAAIVARHDRIRARQRERVASCDLPHASATLAATARWLTTSSGLAALAPLSLQGATASR